MPWPSSVIENALQCCWFAEKMNKSTISVEIGVLPPPFNAGMLPGVGMIRKQLLILKEWEWNVQDMLMSAIKPAPHWPIFCL